MVTKILVPTDFSEEANNAFEVALQLARRTGSQIHVLHAIEPPYISSFNAMGTYVPPPTIEDVYMVKLVEQSQDRMRELVETGRQAGVEVKHEVEVDRIINKIRSTVEEEGVDLVVMGSKGIHGMDEMLIGSNTEKVVRLASCPVLTVKQRHERFDVQNILFPTNFDEDLAPVMHRVKEAQKLFGAQLHLLYVNTPGTFESTRNLRERMLAFAEQHQLQNFTTNVWNDETEEDGVLHFADQSGADLIMMVTHGRTGLGRLLSGSITEGLVNHASKPVLTFSIKAMRRER
jgi:nucleotide-binding universal stress UspA family protein